MKCDGKILCGPLKVQLEPVLSTVLSHFLKYTRIVPVSSTSNKSTMFNVKEKPSTSSKSPKQVKVVPVKADAFVEPNPSLAEKGQALQDYPSGIAWKNISKTVLSHVTKEPIKLLNNCSGVVNGGEIVALMGLSGCGKTTLLKVLSGRDQNFCTGDVYFGRHQVVLGQSHLTSDDIKRQIGYVAQDDVFFGTLTVKEQLLFSVQLRGNLQSKEEEVDAVQQLISDLNLTRCADNPISVISGGERKRCSIATELLAEPCVLVLDEATSGLDSAVSAALIYNLRNLANGYNTPPVEEKATKGSSKYRERGPRQKLAVIMSIHQPSTGLFYEFNKVMFLVEGRVAYYGSTGRVMSYLARAGYELPKVLDDNGNKETLAYNPADYMMELLFSIIPQVQAESLAHVDDTKKKKKQSQCKNAKERWELVRQKFLREKGSKFIKVLKATAFKRSRFAPEFVGWWPRYILAEVYDPSQAEGEIARFVDAFLSVRGESAPQQPSVKRGHSFWHELRVLLHRSHKCSSRSSALSMLTISEVLVVGTLAGLTWFQTKLEEENVSKFAGFLFFVCAYWFFAGLFTGLLDFLPERLVVAKDHAAGAYRLSSYFLSRTLGGIPPRIVLPAVFAVVAGLLAMHPDIYTASSGAGTFIAVIFLLMLTTLTGEALGVFLGIASNNLDRSVTIANVTALAMTIFGGFYIKKLPIFMDWLKYLSVLKYCFDALCQVQFPSDTYISCDSGWYIGNCYGQREIDGSTVRAFLDVDRLSLGGNIGAMVAIYFGLKIAGYLALVYVSK